MLTTSVPQTARAPDEPGPATNYLDLYGLSKPPFSATPEPGAFILFGSHKRAFELLVDHVTKNSGTVVLQGEEGIGKTATMRSLAAVATQAGLRTIVVSRPANGRVSLMQLVAALKGQPSADNVTVDDAIDHFLTPPRKVLLADDIDLMPAECGQLLASLTKRMLKDRNGPVVVVSTSTDLTAEPKRPELSALAGLAANTIRLPRLTSAEVVQYIERSLWIAGGTIRRLIAADAMKPIIARSGGVPAVANRVMEAVLTAGFARGDSMITTKTVASATGPAAPRPPRRDEKLTETAGTAIQFAALGLLAVGASAFLYRGLTGPSTSPRTNISPTPLPPSVTETVQEEPKPSKPAERLTPEVILALMKRGDQSLNLGDVAAARLLYQRAAEAGDGAAAIALGKTYDPNSPTAGSKPDALVAAQWYLKAINLGDPHASELLKKLGNH